MKRSFFLLAMSLTACIATAQFTPCLYDLAVEQLENQNPGYREHMQRGIEEALLESRAKNAGIVYTIPVVVHVVWRDPAENIPQARIEAQIRVLNETFRRQNPDTVNTRSIFHPVVDDPKIEFVLSLVIRVQTNEFFQPTFTFSGTTLPDKVKRTAQGGSDAVDPPNHLNIWVCAIRPLTILGTQSPILGYAYPPAGLANWPSGSSAPAPELEGVVVDYRTVGDSLTYNAWGLNIPMRGRTVVHEVGHYLGLRHISGDGLLGLLGLPDCDTDDGVADTPNQGRQSQFVCNPAQNTCTDAAGDLPDMIENYMDYSSEVCQNSFTQGQIAIMRAVLEGPRADLPLTPSRTRNPLAGSTGGTIFPNPSTGLLRLRLHDNTDFYSYTVSDALGNVWVSASSGAPQEDIDLSTLPAGIYFLSVKPVDRQGWTLKLIKQ